MRLICDVRAIYDVYIRAVYTRDKINKIQTDGRLKKNIVLLILFTFTNRTSLIFNKNIMFACDKFNKQLLSPPAVRTSLIKNKQMMYICARSSRILNVYSQGQDARVA